MYTILWQEATSNGIADRWERFEDRDEVLTCLQQLKENPGVCEGDVWIFLPEANEWAMEYHAFLDSVTSEENVATMEYDALFNEHDFTTF